MRYIRVGGIAGLTFIALVVGTNIPIGASGKPAGEATVSEIAAYFSEYDTISLVASYTGPLIWLALPLFAIGVLVATRDTAGKANPWAIAGVAGAVMQNGLFSLVIATDVVLATRADSLAALPQFTQTLWDIQHAFFALNGASLALALSGFAMAALTSRATSRWFAGLGLVGAFVLMVSATQSSAAISGPPVIIGFVGFIIWVTWIASFSVKLLRTQVPTSAAAAEMSTS